jgi:hypothetical protein
MDGGNEQRVAIKFYVKAGLSAIETLVLVQKTYGNETLNGSKVFRWYSRFRDGRELAEDDERGGRPKSTRTEVNIVTRRSMKETLIVLPSASMTLESITLNFCIQAAKIMNFLTSLEK